MRAVKVGKHKAFGAYVEFDGGMIAVGIKDHIVFFSLFLVMILQQHGRYLCLCGYTFIIWAMRGSIWTPAPSSLFSCLSL